MQINMERRGKGKMTQEKAEEIQAILNMCNTRNVIAELYENRTVDKTILVYGEMNKAAGRSRTGLSFNEKNKPTEMITDTGMIELDNITGDMGFLFDLEKYILISGRGKERQTYLVCNEGYIINIKDLNCKQIKHMKIKISSEQMKWIRKVSNHITNKMSRDQIINEDTYQSKLLHKGNLYQVEDYIDHKAKSNQQLTELIAFRDLKNNTVIYFKYKEKAYRLDIPQEDISKNDLKDIIAGLKVVRTPNFENDNIIIMDRFIYDKQSKAIYLIVECTNRVTQKFRSKKIIEDNWIYILNGADSEEIVIAYNISTNTLYDIEAVYSDGKINLLSISKNHETERLRIQTKIGKKGQLIKTDCNIEKYNWNLKEVNGLDEILESEDM